MEVTMTNYFSKNPKKSEIFMGRAEPGSNINGLSGFGPGRAGPALVVV